MVYKVSEKMRQVHEAQEFCYGEMRRKSKDGTLSDEILKLMTDSLHKTLVEIGKGK